MKTQMTPRSRSFWSGLTALAITTVLVSSLVEALNPALILSNGAQADPEAIATVHDRRDAYPEA
ncbi:MAG: hypothetical protein ACT4UQ_05160 [Gammaproteobacteria bacterium]